MIEFREIHRAKSNCDILRNILCV